MTAGEIDQGDRPASALLVDESAAEVAGNVLLLPPSVERQLNDSDESLGVLGQPFDRRNPFFMGLTAALGVAVAYVMAKGIADITSVLVIIGLALFIAIGLNPIIDWPGESR